MQNVIQTVANTFQIVSTLWMIFFGGKAIWEIIKIRIGVKPSTIMNLLLAAILFVLVSFRANLIPIPWHSLSNSTASSSTVGSTPFPPSNGLLTINDSLSSNSKDAGWEEDSYPGASCRFSNGAYAASDSTKNQFWECMAYNHTFDNIAYEVSMVINKGDCGGMIFRSNKAVTNFYIFDVCKDGTYGLSRYDNNSYAATLSGGTFVGIKKGLGQQNTIAVEANDYQISIYVNNLEIASASDDTYNQGLVGLVAWENNTITQVAYTNAKVWVI